MLSSNQSRKIVFLGLLVLLIAGAAFFFLRQQTTDPGAPIDFQQSNYPNDFNSAKEEDAGVDVLDTARAQVQQEIINNSMAELSEADQVKFQSFIDVATSGRDNDPRIDKDLQNLSPELKNQLKSYYRNLLPEKRNERGFISFLIARDFKTSEDLDFLREIFAEEPCLSMSDCKSLTPRDPHMSNVDDISLNYPQLAALYQIEKQLQNKAAQILNDPALRTQLRATLAQAADSSVPKVREKAEQLQKKFSL